MRFRCQALIDTARDAPCSVRLPEICNKRRETTVWAHSDAGVHGKSGGEKAHDCFGFHSCSACHEALPKLPRAERERVERQAMDRTLLRLWQGGALQIAGRRPPAMELPGRMIKRQRFSDSTASPDKCVRRRTA